MNKQVFVVIVGFDVAENFGDQHRHEQFEAVFSTYDLADMYVAERIKTTSNDFDYTIMTAVLDGS